MANNLYTTKTAALRATKADINKLDTKKMLLNGKNILEYIKDATPTIKHSQDTRETVTENDLWGQWVETKADGTIIIHDVTNYNGSKPWNTSITKVEDNKVYIGDTMWANVQTNKIKNGSLMFAFCSQLTSFNNDLSNLTNGGYMFAFCSSLTTFSSDLSSLVDGYSMFTNCNLTTFTSDLSSLTDGFSMFGGCNLTSFSSDLSSLTDGTLMFSVCENLTTFTSDLSSLTDGTLMFLGCTNFTSFSSILSSLTNGYMMFYQCSLDAESVMYIADSIKDITAEKQLYIDGTIPYVTLSNDVYSAPKGFMSDGTYVYTYKKPQPFTTTISASDVGSLTLGINVTNNSSTIQQQLEDFAKKATFDSWAELKQEFVDKGWTVAFQYGGTFDTIPDMYNLRNGEQIIPCPIFAKLIQIEDKDSAQYCTEDASTFYNIEWGHDVTDTSSYTQFNSLEDAMVAYGVILKQLNN